MATWFNTTESCRQGHKADILLVISVFREIRTPSFGHTALDGGPGWVNLNCALRIYFSSVEFIQ